ncbi:hypothetical protein ACWDX6_23960 [Streptomyces sp. NPDC003027]
MKDSFGVEIDEGDYVLSAASSTSFFKLGVVYLAPSGRAMMEVTRSNWDRAQRRSEVGSNVLVLRKADGTVPAHVGVTPPTVADVEEALRDFMAHHDYDHHKALEHDEETGESHYPQIAEAFHRSLMGGAE